MAEFAASPHRSSAPILVTGIPRSGTTWVGRMLHASGETAYVAEPLNIWRSPRPLRSQTRGWPGYPYVTAESEDMYLAVLADIVGLRMNVLRELRAARSREDLSGVVSTWAAFLIGRARRRRPLVKEPHALFLAPWLVERLGGHAVITVRHPAAVVSSWKRIGWPVDFGQLLNQPLLVRDWLGSYKTDMTALQSSDDLIAQVSLLWTMMYDYVARARGASDALHVVRHEDLSLSPVATFRELYAALGLGFTSRVEKVVRRTSSPRNPKELAIDEPYAVRLDSRANLENWKQRLTPDEVRRIRDITAHVARHYYSEESWGQS
ncbi:MAG: sulfotransferase [Gaiellaceae bacterium]